MSWSGARLQQINKLAAARRAREEAMKMQEEDVERLGRLLREYRACLEANEYRDRRDEYCVYRNKPNLDPLGSADELLEYIDYDLKVVNQR